MQIQTNHDDSSSDTTKILETIEDKPSNQHEVIEEMIADPMSAQMTLQFAVNTFNETNGV